MALEGTLRDFSLADIFQLIGLQRKTGVLTLRSAEDVVTISFLDGKVVAADSLHKRLEDRLGQVLLRTGMIDQEQLEGALREQMETLERLGRIFLKRGIVNRDDMRRAMEKQILQVIFRVFRWKDGDYQFSQETSIDYDAELVVPISAESILMEGARMLDEWPIIEKRIAHRGVIYLPTPAARDAEVATAEELEELESFEFETEPPVSTGKLRITPVERDVLALLDGLSTVDDVVKKSPHSEFETCKALYTLLTRSLIREASRDELTRALLHAAAPTPPKPAPLRLPWLAIVVAPLLIAGLLLSPRNPMNPLLGPSPTLFASVGTASSWFRLWGLWQTLQARATLVGSYPLTLSDLVQDRLLPERALKDPWHRPYRYALYDHSVLVAGNAPSGTPDPNLILVQHLSFDEELDTRASRGVTLAP